MPRLRLGDLTVDVVLKDIKNVHLSVHPPTGRVRIAAPARMKLDRIRLFAISRLGWIRKHQRAIRAQDRETVREYVDRESHYLWGRRYLLRVIEDGRAPCLELRSRWIHLRVRPSADEETRRAIMERWYREQVRTAAGPLIAKWEPVIGATVRRVFVQRMKTRWGGCNQRRGSIRLNTELAKKPRECLEYVVVHEMVHLLERTHSERFVRLMDGLMPSWRHHRDELNRLPLAHEDWRY